MEENQALKAKILKLEDEIKSLKSQSSDRLARQKINTMSSEVVDSNPYR